MTASVVRPYEGPDAAQSESEAQRWISRAIPQVSLKDGGRLPALKLRPMMGREVVSLCELDDVRQGERSYFARTEMAVTTDSRVALAGAMHAV